MSNSIRCNWCGKFARKPLVHQPHTEVWKLEPNDPELVCEQCQRHLPKKDILMSIECDDHEYRRLWYSAVARCNAWVLEHFQQILHWELFNELHRLTPLHHMPYTYVQKVKKLWIDRSPSLPKENAGQVFDDNLAYWSEWFNKNHPVLKGVKSEREAVD